MMKKQNKMITLKKLLYDVRKQEEKEYKKSISFNIDLKKFD